jgi:hypothetical protein
VKEKRDVPLINGREARFFNFKEKDCYPKEILEHPADWKLIFNGEDWSNKRVFYADEQLGVITRYATNDKGENFIKDGIVAEHAPEKGRVRILKVGDEIDTVEKIWGIRREED